MTQGRARLAALVAIVLAVVAACSRGGRARPAPAPAARPDTTTAARPDTAAAAGDSAAARARRDSIARDSTARAAALADSARRAAAGRPRRAPAPDPTSRCGYVRANQAPDPPSGRFQQYTDANGNSIAYYGGGVVARCRGVANRLQADSAEYYEVNGMLVLVSNVVYDEPGRVHLTSNRLTYYTANEQLIAEGNVVVTMPSGTSMTGPQAEYLRESPGIRARSRLSAQGRPTLRVITDPRPAPGARDSARGRAQARASTAPRDTAIIIANTIVDEADSLVFASGQVQINRPDVSATSDSATFDQGTELAHLINNAKIQGQRGRPFTLSGTLIDLFSRDRDLTRVLSRGSARVVSEELDLKSDTVDLRIRDSRVERAYAWGPSRATATSPERDVVADSIEAVLPDQRIRELHAVRRAVARSVPDSTKIASTERDFLSGDTIVARFDTLAAARDTTRNPPVRQIVAAGNATSYYQIASNEGRTGRPGINYVKGRRITVDFDSSTVQTVTVTDSATGVYLQPADSTDSTAATRRRSTTTTPGARGGPPGGGPPTGRAVPGRPPTARPEESAGGAR